MEILSNAGHTKVEVNQSMKDLNRAKINRSITKTMVKHYMLYKVEDAVESACRKFKRLLRDDHWKSERALFV